jgi:predicted nucleic acid-binding protein
MILTDAGPLIAILDRGDADHARCVAALDRLAGPLVTTWPAFTEAIYLLGARAGWPAQQCLWRLLLRDDLQVASLSPPVLRRAYDLMNKYRDLPMDLADATLVALAETLGTTRIFTLDADFRAYRLHGRKAFDIIP